MKKIYLYFMLVLGVTLTSCSNDEETLTPSGKDDGYIIAKGDADYDQTINEFYKKYSSCLLYQWTEKDVYWTPSGWMNGVLGTQDEGGKDGFVVYPPEKDYISNQLHILDRLWFRFYSAKALQKLLPYKIMLCSNVQETEVSWIFEPSFSMVYTGKDVSAHYNYDNIAVSFASANANNLTKDDSLRICTDLNSVFLKSMAGRKMISVPKKFSEGIDYSKAGNLYNNSDYFANGIFPDTKNYSPDADKDWTAILTMMISYPENFLTQEPQSTLEEWVHKGDNFYDGILNPAKDSKGLIKKRYDIARQYFIDNFGTDLQAIGNEAAKWKQ